MIVEGNVGIGAYNPSAKLHVVGGSLLASGASGATPVSGSGTRLMWVPAKAAFRAGAVIGSEWDDAQVGTYSMALGYRLIASGLYSVAIGTASTSSGESSVTIGYSNTANAVRSIAIGEQNVASGVVAIALGLETTASGNASTSMGRRTTASGDYSTAMGYQSTASGDYSTAIGKSMTVQGTYSMGINLDTTSSTITQSNTMAIMGGKVGIGIVSPNSELHIGGTTPQITIGDAGAEDTSILFDGNAQDFYFALDDSTDDIAIGTGSTIGSNVKMVIENGGNVGIGMANPQRPLHISDVMRLEPRSSAPSSPSEGDIYVNSTDNHIYCYLSSGWVQLDNVP
jgi:hypothetical protein